MKTIIALLVLVTTQVAALATELNIQVLKELAIFEPFESHLFHAGHLWVPSNRNNGLGAEYSLTLFDGNGTKVLEKVMPHSMRYLYPYAANSVLTVGVALSDQLTHYSIVTLKNSQLSVQSWTVPLGAYVNEWAGKVGLNYFTDPGGLDDSSPIGEALRTLLTSKAGGYQYLKPRIHNPRYPLYAANHLYVIENGNQNMGRDLEVIDFNSDKPVKLYKGNDMTNLISIKDGNFLLAADNGANEVVVLDTSTGAIVRKFEIQGNRPKGMAMMGKCVVVGTETTKHIDFINFESKAPVASWDLSAVSKLYGIRSIAADEKTGNVFVRSAYPATLGDPVTDRNSVVMVGNKDSIKDCF